MPAKANMSVTPLRWQASSYKSTSQKKPRSSRDRIGAEVGTVEELPCEGDQTFVKPAESSVPTPVGSKLAENDMFIANAAIATNRPCRHSMPPPESNHDTVP